MSSTSTESSGRAEPAIRVVGIGASAGGLVPLEHFLAAVPAGSGMAYVVVQHLDPTSMTVRKVEQDMRIEPDTVFVIPPDTELRIVDDHLSLSGIETRRGV